MRQGSHHPRGKQSLVQMKDQPPRPVSEPQAPAQVRPAPPAADVLGGLQSGVQETKTRPQFLQEPTTHPTGDVFRWSKRQQMSNFTITPLRIPHSSVSSKLNTCCEEEPSSPKLSTLTFLE